MPRQDPSRSADASDANPTWAGLFPASVHTVTQAELSGEPALLPEELGFVAHAVPARAHEFAAGRSCARAALARLGCPPVAIVVGARREPVWPAGFVGSITHCPGHCAAAVARSADDAVDAIVGVGLDAEPAEPLPSEIVELVCTTAERTWIGQRSGDASPWDRLVFSAKESVFKCLFPLVRGHLDFHEVEIVPVGRGDFRAHAASLALAEQVVGRWACRGRFILTTAVVSGRSQHQR